MTEKKAFLVVGFLKNAESVYDNCFIICSTKNNVVFFYLFDVSTGKE